MAVLGMIGKTVEKWAPTKIQQERRVASFGIFIADSFFKTWAWHRMAKRESMAVYAETRMPVVNSSMMQMTTTTTTTTTTTSSSSTPPNQIRFLMANFCRVPPMMGEPKLFVILFGYCHVNPYQAWFKLCSNGRSPWGFGHSYPMDLQCQLGPVTVLDRVEMSSPVRFNLVSSP